MLASKWKHRVDISCHVISYETADTDSSNTDVGLANASKTEHVYASNRAKNNPCAGWLAGSRGNVAVAGLYR